MEHLLEVGPDGETAEASDSPDEMFLTVGDRSVVLLCFHLDAFHETIHLGVVGELVGSTGWPMCPYFVLCENGSHLIAVVGGWFLRNKTL